MTLDPKSGNYTARIPADFRNPKWDLMYFVEVVDKKGAGRMFPDLEVETPYVVLREGRTGLLAWPPGAKRYSICGASHEPSGTYRGRGHESQRG